VLRGPDGRLDLAPGLIWIQMATVGMEWMQRFVNTATRYQLSFFDAPVSGSAGPAQAGELTILASGPEWLRKTRPGVRRARPYHRLAGPGRQRHPGQAGPE
jgi:3-hydroxyisobutyrate dehydrogenase-like beta-hydroxyacid dehydrogenase